MNEAAKALVAATSEPVRERGIVKWFNATYGFIQRQSGEDVFVHQTNIRLKNPKAFRTLVENQPVEFTVSEGRNNKGLEARDVVPLE